MPNRQFRNVGALAFLAFLRNTAYQPGLVTNLYLSCAERARMLSVLLTGVDWTKASFDPGRSAARAVDGRAKSDRDQPGMQPGSIPHAPPGLDLAR